ncbi:hypothetical protein [Xanthomonas phage XAJ2]|uniref:Uncharacterized protein n=1 Tax=Xanthomonas phage XAJ2 TaxID=1775249 RepID=A0A1I9L2F8_9CAUD|nr:hypothetical protein [Xanthomonas phage XAJ2]
MCYCTAQIRKPFCNSFVCQDERRKLEGKIIEKHVKKVDEVVEANRLLLLQRSQTGINKYGVTLAAAGLTRRQLLQHALEEALDLANYLQAELMRIDADGGQETNRT